MIHYIIIILYGEFCQGEFSPVEFPTNCDATALFGGYLEPNLHQAINSVMPQSHSPGPY